MIELINFNGEELIVMDQSFKPTHHKRLSTPQANLLASLQGALQDLVAASALCGYYMVGEQKQGDRGGWGGLSYKVSHDDAFHQSLIFFRRASKPDGVRSNLSEVFKAIKQAMPAQVEKEHLHFTDMTSKQVAHPVRPTLGSHEVEVTFHAAGDQAVRRNLQIHSTYGSVATADNAARLHSLIEYWIGAVNARLVEEGGRLYEEVNAMSVEELLNLPNAS